jgi:Flp pilus assembly pilin Flp
MDIGMLHAYLAARIGLKSEKGQTLVEYALIISLIAVVAVVALKFLGGRITQMFSSTGSQL